MGLDVSVTLPTGEMATLANSGIFELLDMVYKTPHNINFSILCSHSYLALKHLDLAAKDQRNELDGSTDEFASNSVALLLFPQILFLTFLPERQDSIPTTKEENGDRQRHCDYHSPSAETCATCC